MATKDFSSKQESMIADYLSWDVVSGSGAAACHPGDIISDNWLGECKTHEKPGHKIFFSKDVWKKICDEAMSKGRSPVLFTDDGSQKIENTWCIVNKFMIHGYTLSRTDKKVSTNLNFTLKELDELYSNIVTLEDLTTIYYETLGDSSVAILPIHIYRMLFEV